MGSLFAGTTSVSRYYLMVDADGAPVTGLSASDFTLRYVRPQSAAVTHAGAALASESAAFSGWGVRELSTTAGVYRVDWPDLAFAIGVTGVTLAVAATGARLQVERVDLPSLVTLADEVWNVLSSDHTIDGTMGKLLRETVQQTDLYPLVETIVDAVWAEITSLESGISYADAVAAVVLATAAIKTKTDQLAFTTGDVRAALASDGLDGVTIETGLNARQAIAIIAAAVAGKLTGAVAGASGTVSVKAAGVPATERISASCDAAGNRNTVSLTPPT